MAKKSNKKTGLIPVIIKRHRDTKSNHPHVIMGDIDNNHVSVGLSTKPKKGKNSPNYALEKDPLGGDKKSYMRRQGTVALKKEYFDQRQGEMSLKDYAKATEYGEKAKQKHIAKKDKKK